MAKTVRKTVRIYRQHDLDLYYLGLSKSFHLGREMKRALVAYANDSVYTPPDIPKSVDDSVVRTSMLLILYFDPQKPEEKKVLDLLHDVKYGYGCPFIKALFRSSMPAVPLSSYFSDNGLQMSNAEVVRDIQKKQATAIIQKSNEKEIVKEDKKALEQNTIQSTSTNNSLQYDESLSDSITEDESNQSIDPSDLNDLFMQMNQLTH